MSDYRFTHLIGRVNYPRPRSPSPVCTGRTHLSMDDINADFYARKLLRNSAPSLCHVLDKPERGRSEVLSSPAAQRTEVGRGSSPIVQSGRFHGSSSLSPTTAVEDWRSGQLRQNSSSPFKSPLDVNERYSTPSYSTGLESTFRPYATTRSVDIRTCPGRPKVFQPSHVIPAVTDCAKCFNNGRRRRTQVFCPHVLERCNTFGGAFAEQLFGQYRDVAMEKQFR